MKKTSLFFILFVALTVATFLWKQNRPVKSFEDSDSNESEQIATTNTTKKSEEVIKNQLIDSQAMKENSGTKIPSADQKIEIEKSFANHLKLLGQCLGANVPVDQDQVEPKYDQIISSLKSSFGDVLVKMDDWSQVDYRSADGSLKRLRTEVEYLENNNPTKRLQYFKLNDQGMPELQNLSEDQMTNPSDEFLNSLQTGSQTLVDEKGSRAYYSEGEELVIVEKNGRVQSFSMSKGDKTFSCTETDSVVSNCQCL